METDQVYEPKTYIKNISFYQLHHVDRPSYFGKLKNTMDSWNKSITWLRSDMKVSYG